MTLSYEQMVWDKADQTDLYREILHDLIIDKDNPYIAKITMAENENDYARMTIGVNFLLKYIVQLTNDVASMAWKESEDKIREDHIRKV